MCRLDTDTDIDAIAAVDLDSLDNDTLGELIVKTTAAKDRLAAACTRMVAEHDRRQAWKHEGAHSGVGMAAPALPPVPR